MSLFCKSKSAEKVTFNNFLNLPKRLLFSKSAKKVTFLVLTMRKKGGKSAEKVTF